MLEQKTSIEVLKSLPGGLWEKFGSSGWGPESEGQFMQFDYGGANAYLSGVSIICTLVVVSLVATANLQTRHIAKGTHRRQGKVVAVAVL